MEDLKVVIGTRTWLGEDWTHVDIDPRPLVGADGSRHPVDVQCDARKIDLPDRCAAEVYSQECLEHFPYKEGPKVLMEWCRLVQPRGKIVIEVPDFLAACNQALVVDTLEMDRGIQQLIFGGQHYPYDFHYTGWTPRMLESELSKLGMVVKDLKRGWEAGYLRVEAIRPV